MYSRKLLVRTGFWIGAGFMLSAYTVMWFLDGVSGFINFATMIVLNGLK